MASSDAKTSLGSEYQVFLNFRGPDTRIGFTDCLYHNLFDVGICVFRDDEELRVGERIDGSLQQAIFNSKIYIPIFSPTYASSQWCLRELEQIVTNNSKLEGEKAILPIFYNVEPDDVKLKTSLYLDAILKLKCEKNLSNEQVDAWRKALMAVGSIKGWEVKKFNGHGELIKLVVDKVVEMSKAKHRLVTEYLVGIDDRVVAVKKLLDVNSDGVRLIQIYGMGGIGKTTLAKVIFNQLSPHFKKYCCFLENVREKSSRTNGFVEMQKKLLFDMGIHAGTWSIDEIDYGMKRTGDALRDKRVLIVLDDVDKSQQVEKLIGMSTLHSGSRILITTRDEYVLQINRLKYPILLYEMEMMETNCALELFSKHAFKSDFPSDDYNDLSREIVFTTGRLPLALEVIGSHLFRKTREQWKEALDKLRKAPPHDVSEKLNISYDALSPEQKQIFLDIACFFIGEDKTNAIYLWENSGLLQGDGFDVLNWKSMIKIKENKFWMHDLLKEFGREIVRKESPLNLGKRSRLWICEEILDTIITKEMKNVEALDLNLHEGYLDTFIKSEEIERFEHLRYLKLNGGTFIGNFANSLANLRWFSWSDPNVSRFSWSDPSSKATTMYLKSVVILQFSDNDYINDSYLQSLIKMARKLKVLSLVRCYNITRTPDFSGCPNLERLTFEHSGLRKIDHSIGKLKCLIELRISFCPNLGDLPEEMGALVNLQCFYVQQCLITKLPNFTWKLKSLREVHFEVKWTDAILANSWELPNDIGMLQNLEVLKVYSCNLKGQLPSEIGSLRFLRILDTSYAYVSKVPDTISMLPRLQILKLIQCHGIQELPMLPTSLTHLQVSSSSLRIVPDLSNLTNLVELDLCDTGGRRNKTYTGGLWWIGGLSKLTKLSLGLHNVPPPTELVSLNLLSTLNLYGFDLQSFPQLPSSLQKLRIDNFNSTLSLSLSLRNLLCLELFRSPMQEFQLDGLQLPNMRELRVLECVSLERLRLSSMRKMQDVVVEDSQKLVEIRFSLFESLEALSIERCRSFERLVYVGEAGDDNNKHANESSSCEGRLIVPFRALNKLQSFILGQCHKMLEIQIVGTTESLESFLLHNCSCVQSLHGLSNLKNLKSLKILHNHQLRIVEGLDKLEFLDELQVRGCGSLERLIDVSSTQLPHNCHIIISGWRKDFWGFLENYKHDKESCFDWTCACFGGGL